MPSRVASFLAIYATVAFSLKLDQLGPFAPPRECSRQWKQLCAYPIIKNITMRVDQAHNPSVQSSIESITNQVNSGEFNQDGFYPWLVRKSDATILASGIGVANLLPINLPELSSAHVEFAKAFDPSSSGHKWVRFVWHGVNRLGYVLQLDDKHAAVVFFDEQDVPPLSSSKCIGATPSSEPACSVYAATRAQARVFYDLLVANASNTDILTMVQNGTYNALAGFSSPIVVTPSMVYKSSMANYTGTTNAPSTADETTPGTLQNGWQTFVGSFPCNGGMCKVLSPFREAAPIIETPTCDQTAGVTPCNLGLAQNIVDSGKKTLTELRMLTGASSFTSVYDYTATPKKKFDLKANNEANADMTMLINTTLGLGMSESAFMTYIDGKQSMWTLTNNQMFYAKSPLLIALPATAFFNANGTNCTTKFAVESNPKCVMSALGSALTELLTTTTIPGFLGKVRQGAFDLPMGSADALRVTVVDQTGMIDASSALVMNGQFLGKRLSNVEFFSKDLAAGLFTTGAWFRYDDTSAPIVGYAVGVTGSKKYFLSVQYTDGHSAAPTMGPTVTPTKYPSKNPTMRPSTMPSKAPSGKPTTPYPTVVTTTTENPDGAMSVVLFCVYGLIGVVSLLLL